MSLRRGAEMQKKQKKQATQHINEIIRYIMMHMPEIKNEHFNQWLSLF
jgi:hypothetical protein